MEFVYQWVSKFRNVWFVREYCSDFFLCRGNHLKMCDLLKNFQTNRAKWQRKTPKEKFDDLYRLGDKMCRLVGIRIFSDMKVYWYTASDGIMYAIYFLLVIYTIDYYTKRGEFLRGLE